MSGKYYYAVRRGRPAIEEVHCAGCGELEEAGINRFLGTFYSLRHALSPRACGTRNGPVWGQFGYRKLLYVRGEG